MNDLFRVQNGRDFQGGQFSADLSRLYLRASHHLTGLYIDGHIGSIAKTTFDNSIDKDGIGRYVVICDAPRLGKYAVLAVLGIILLGALSY